MNRYLKILLSVPRSIWFNLRFLPPAQAVRLPVWIAPNVRIKNLCRGGIILSGQSRPGLIKIGYHEADGVDVCGVHTILNIDKRGKLVISDDAHIGQGAVIRIYSDAVVTLGRNFAISGTTSIIASKSITFGDDVQLSWNTLIMDSDAHQIFDPDGNLINPPEEIHIGNKVWIAANTTILKKSVIGNNVVVAANSLVNKPMACDNCIVGGQPAKVVKAIGHFSI